MDNIYLTCEMNLRKEPSLKSKIIRVIPKGSKLDVMFIADKNDGYVWFKVKEGYIANVPEVYFHSESYNGDSQKVKTTVKTWLISSLESTTLAIDEMTKALDNL